LQRGEDMSQPTVRDYMSSSPITVGQTQSLAAAHRLMRENGIRHLPVLEGGELVGILSQRDLHLVETLRDVDPATVLVEEAMTPDPYTVGPRVHLTTVMRHMAEHRQGSAVVIDGGKVVGVFTTVDALRAAADLLGPPHGLARDEP
jgi:acetoin utilization protein AcuB